MITLNFELSKQDYFQFYYYTIWLAPGKKAAVIKDRVKSFLLFTLAFILVRFAVKPSNFDLFFFYAILVLASIYIIPLFFIEGNCWKQVVAFYNNPLNANTFQPTELIFSETGIQCKETVGESVYKWKSIVKKVEINSHFFLYLNDNQAFILPKAAIISDIDKLNLLELFGRHIPFNAEVGHLVKN